MRLPCDISLHPSRQLTLLLLLAHGGAVAVVFAIVLPVWLKLLLLAAIAASLGRILYRSYGRQRIIRLILRGDGLLEYVRSNDQPGEARIHPNTTVTPWLSVLLLQQGKRIEVLTVLADGLSREDFRHLRLWLRWHAAKD
ncbi:MAG: hypothetical protein HY066_15240 [Betaproteobacteria bacterium]|nr:hypothetical protein [Betaproteobacteria bacterium]